MLGGDSLLASAPSPGPAAADSVGTDAGFWQRQPPLPGTLFDVSALSATDVWMTGFTGGLRNPHKRPLLEHYDGVRWKRLWPPRIFGGADEWLITVSATSDTDVWVSGLAQRAGPRRLQRPYMLRWDGLEWVNVPLPENVVAEGWVAAFSSDDVWLAVTLRGSIVQDALAHWDGTAWSVTTPPQLRDDIYSMSAAASNDVWLLSYHNRVEHWDGSSWKLVAIPDLHSVGHPQSHVTQIAALGNGRAVAVGDDIVLQQGVAVFLDASGVTRKVPFGPYGELSWDAITARSPTDIWAGSGDGSLGHWDGHAWTLIPDRVAKGIFNLAAVPGKLFAVTDRGGKPLIGND
jgi:hypothetical protein